MSGRVFTTGLPSWVRWIALDEDGSWWAFEAEPHEYSRGWYENEVGRRMKLATESCNPGWRYTLRSYP